LPQFSLDKCLLGSTKVHFTLHGLDGIQTKFLNTSVEAATVTCNSESIKFTWLFNSLPGNGRGYIRWFL